MPTPQFVPRRPQKEDRNEKEEGQKVLTSTGAGRTIDSRRLLPSDPWGLPLNPYVVA